MPETIDILGIKYTVCEVECVNKTEPRKGEIDYLSCTIRIDRSMPDDLKRQTLMHEILPGMFEALGMYDLAQDEEKVQGIATALHQIFRRQKVFS